MTGDAPDVGLSEAALSPEAADLLRRLNDGDPAAVAEIHRLMDDDPLPESDPEPLLSPEEMAEVARRCEEMARTRAQGAASGGNYLIGAAFPAEAAHARDLAALRARLPQDAAVRTQGEDTPDDAALQAVEGAVPGGNTRTPAERPERLPTSPECPNCAALRERAEVAEHQRDRALLTLMEWSDRWTDERLARLPLDVRVPLQHAADAFRAALAAVEALADRPAATACSDPRCEHGGASALYCPSLASLADRPAGGEGRG